ncbi:hypothetical protein QYZ87_04890 [Porphyromonadaceae bacterium W3.11]|nr:hypothetical protein [Porphyromonadaceae bacterium W3.11]
MNISDWIDAVGVLVSIAGVFVAIWVGYTLQTVLTAERTIKDILIKRIDKLSDKYDLLYSKILEEGINPRLILSWFKSFNIEADALLKKASEMYGIDSSFLKPFQADLRELITNDESYMNNFKSEMFKPSNALTNDIQGFHKNNHHLFLDLICKINDQKTRRK